jgi:hypothetical protein
MRMSWTEIAVDMAKQIAAAHGCELDTFSLDGVEFETVDGQEVVHMQASATMTPLADNIPFELSEADAA